MDQTEQNKTDLPDTITWLELAHIEVSWATECARKSQYAKSPWYGILPVTLLLLTHVLGLERSNNVRTLGHIRRNTADIMQARLPYHQTNPNSPQLFLLCPRPSYHSLQCHCLHPISFVKHCIAQIFWTNQIFISGNRSPHMTIPNPL